jgi:hypothetical protein
MVWLFVYMYQHLLSLLVLFVCWKAHRDRPRLDLVCEFFSHSFGRVAIVAVAALNAFR